MNIAEYIVALRYLVSKRREKFISVTAIFSLIGIALGVAALIIVTSVMNGFRKEFSDKVINFNGNLTAYVMDMNLDIPDTVTTIEKIEGIEHAIPMIERHALISNDNQIRGMLVYGISKDDLHKYMILRDGICAGSLEKFNSENSAILGSALSQKLRMSVGGEICILAPELDDTGLGLFPVKKTFNLVAKFKSGMYEYDSNVAIIPIEIAQKLFNINASGILIYTKSNTDVGNIKKQISNLFGDKLHVTDWMKNNSAFMNAVKVERNVMFLILTLITLVASFNIISCMIMLVKDKSKDIAILKTLGFSNHAIMRIFFMIGSAIGVIGTTIGAIAGILFSENIESIRRCIESLLSTDLFSAEVYFLTQLPSAIDYLDVLYIVCIALFLSCLATIYPARKAGSLQPAEVLKYE